MSKTNKIFQSIPVKIPDRSGFDLTTERICTAPVGTLVPINWFPVVPGDTISSGVSFKVTLPPFAAPFSGRIDAEITAFFVPYRQIWSGWESFITQNYGIQKPISGGRNDLTPELCPYVLFSEIYGQGILRNGLNLFECLGVPSVGQTDRPTDFMVNALPALAYHWIVDNYYRDSNNMKPFFPKVPVTSSLQSLTYSALRAAELTRLLPKTYPYASSVASGPNPDQPYRLSLSSISTSSNARLLAEVDSSLTLNSLRQRCWEKDYFTTATSRPQAGDPASITFEVQSEATQEGITGMGAITIAQIRQANSLQKWLERQNIAGTEYGMNILAHFGVVPPSATLNQPILLGTCRTPVYVGSVENNSNAAAPNGTKTNPYGSALGTAAGFGSAADKGSLISNYDIKEHGCVIFMFSLVPHAYYATGTERDLMHMHYGDFLWPEFANVGDQPIYLRELCLDESGSTESPSVFGYAQRYSEYKFKRDRIIGPALINGGLSPYALSRGFDPTDQGQTDLGSQFLEIPTDFLDQVYSVSSNVGYGCIVDAFFDTKALRILPEYSLPML